MAVDYISMDVHVKLDDSRLNGSQDIRRADFVSNEPTKEHIEAYHIRQKRFAKIYFKNIDILSRLNTSKPYKLHVILKES